MIIQTGNRTDIPAFYSEWFANRLREGFGHIDAFSAMAGKIILVNNYAICDPYTIGEGCENSVWWNCPNDSTHSYVMTPKNSLLYHTRDKEACPICKGLRRKKRHFI